MSEDNITIENEALQSQYTKAVELLKSDSLQDVLQARELFKELGTYQDASSYINQCSEKIASIRASKLLNKYSDGEPDASIRPETADQKSIHSEPKTEAVDLKTEQAAPVAQPAPAVAPASKSQNKIGLIIAVIVLIIAVFAGGLALGGFFNKGEGNSEEQSTVVENNTASSAEEQTENTPVTISPEFSKADILKIEELRTGVDDELSEDSYFAEYKVTNTSSEVIWTFDMNFIFKDKDGNQLYEDGRFYSGKLEPGKFTYMHAFTYDVDVNDVDSVEVKSYTYKYGFNRYDIDLQNKTLDLEQEDKSYYENADFKKTDVLGFEIKDNGIDEDGSYETEIIITNNGKDNIKEFSVTIEYYDKNGNPISQDGRYSDSLLKPGKSVKLGSYCYDYGVIKAKDISSFAVIGYDYILQGKDSSGFDKYTLNFVNNTAYGEDYSD